MILNLEQWLRRRCRLKTFLSRALVAPLLSTGTIGEVLDQGVMRKISVKIF